MEVEFMTTDTTLPPCMPLPRAMLRLSAAPPRSCTPGCCFPVRHRGCQRDFVYPFPHRGTGSGACQQHTDLEAFPE